MMDITEDFGFRLPSPEESIAMTTPNKHRANQENALHSTGPRTSRGRNRSSKNALVHGLYSTSLVPAVGESPEVFAELVSAVRREIQPQSIIEERLADRAALLLWRYDRIARYEAATAAQAAAALKLPPDPDTITGEGVTFDATEPGPNATPTSRLAYLRDRLRCWGRVRESCDLAIAALDGESAVDPLSVRDPHVVRRHIEDLLGWNWEASAAKWSAALTVHASARGSPEGTFPRFVARLATEAGKNPQMVLQEIRTQFVTKRESFDKSITAMQAEEVSLVSEMRAAREQAAAAALFADGDAVDRVMRLEAHLTRQLSLVLDQIDRLRGTGIGGVSGAGAFLRALPAGAVRALPQGPSVGSFRSGGGETEEVPVSVPMQGRG